MARKTFKEKLHNKKDLLPEIKPVNCQKLIDKYGNGNMVIPAPLEIDGIMKQVPENMLITTEQIRDFFNEKYDAVYTCPLCTGIFCKLVAFAAEEDKAEGIQHTTPYWRTLKSKGEINEKFPGGIEQQIELLTKEGHRIFKKGKKYFVQDFKDVLYVIR